MVDLSGKAAFITGASAGIGAAAAKHLAQLGAPVALFARSQEKLERLAAEITDAGGSALVCVGDVSAEPDVKAAIDQCVAEFGALDVLLNNAGTIDPIARIEDSDPKAWGKVVDINIKGVYFGIRHALPVMKRNDGGTIINISSGAATGALEGWSHYCATKAAVLSLTRCVHKEEAENGIRMVGLSPGTVATDMQHSIKGSGINPVSKLPFSDHIPPEWVARAVAYLCTSQADQYLGGDFSLKTDEGRAAVGLPPVS